MESVQASDTQMMFQILKSSDFASYVKAVFLYNWDSSAQSALQYTSITNVRLNFVVDVNSALTAPSPIRIASGVDLRNQNQTPTASFQVTGSGNHGFILNGSASQDPEGRSLSYFWYRGRTATFTPTSSRGSSTSAGPSMA